MGCPSKRNEKKSVQTFSFFIHVGIEALENESAAVFLPENVLLPGVACHYVHYMQEERKLLSHDMPRPNPSIPLGFWKQRNGATAYDEKDFHVSVPLKTQLYYRVRWSMFDGNQCFIAGDVKGCCWLMFFIESLMIWIVISCAGMAETLCTWDSSWGSQPGLPRSTKNCGAKMKFRPSAAETGCGCLYHDSMTRLWTSGDERVQYTREEKMAK